MSVLGLGLVLVAAQAAVACSDGENCDPIHYGSECRQQSALWAEVPFDPEGNQCPSLEQFLDHNVVPGDVGLRGDEFAEVTSRSDQVCCYATITHPCR